MSHRWPALPTSTRRLLPAGVLLASCLALGQTPATSATAAPQPDHDRLMAMLLDHGPDAPLMIAAHRAQWREYPENSLAAIDAAIEDGAEVIELDVMRTKDGHLVLMHDTTVNRTTNGSGAVADLTLEQIRELRLKEGLGGSQAPLTGHRVPTLDEAMELVRDRALVNLDKGWSIREDIYDVLEETDTVDHGLFKSGAGVSEVDEFLAAHPDALYMHIIGDGNAGSVGDFTVRQPVAYEVVFDDEDDPQAQPAVLDEIQESSRVWANAMWDSLAAGMTDEASLRDEDLGWAPLVDEYDASMIQTDNVEALDHWRDGGDLATYGLLPGNRSLRIQAEDYAPGGEGVGYHDLDGNRCNVMRLDEGVDICASRGAHAVQWIRGGEWLKYDVEIDVPGRYTVSARMSTPYTPAGTMILDWDGEPGEAHQVENTTDHAAFRLQELETRRLTRGTHELRVWMPTGVTQNFNIDYFQLDRAGRPSR